VNDWSGISGSGFRAERRVERWKGYVSEWSVKHDSLRGKEMVYSDARPLAWRGPNASPLVAHPTRSLISFVQRVAIEEGVFRCDPTKVRVCKDFDGTGP
jgi:hypothetical protein